MADLTVIGCQVETTATAAEVVPGLGRARVSWPAAIARGVRGWSPAAACSGLGALAALHVAVGVPAGVKPSKSRRMRVPDSRVLWDAGWAGEAQKAAIGAALA